MAKASSPPAFEFFLPALNVAALGCCAAKAAELEYEGSEFLHKAVIFLAVLANFLVATLATGKPKKVGVLSSSASASLSVPPQPKETADVLSAHFLGDTLTVDERDQKTPDDWVKRHPELVRLTGRHPFNCEPPLPKLKEGGFITPQTLHYVRNHGG